MKHFAAAFLCIALLIAGRECRAAEKAVKLLIPDCSNSLVNAVVVGILEDVPGVRHARVNGMESAATVFFDNRTTGAPEIINALRSASIRVESVSVPSGASGRVITP